MNPEKHQNTNLSLLKQIFLANILSFLNGHKTNLKLKGKPDEINCVARALSDTKEFHNELKNPKKSIKSVMEKLAKKRESAEEFERMFSVKWPV